MKLPFGNSRSHDDSSALPVHAGPRTSGMTSHDDKHPAHTNPHAHSSANVPETSGTLDDTAEDALEPPTGETPAQRLAKTPSHLQSTSSSSEASVITVPTKKDEKPIVRHVPASDESPPKRSRRERKADEKEDARLKEEAREPDVYDRFPVRQKKIITAVAGFAAFIGPITSSSFLPSIPQIATDVHSTDAVINYTVAIFIFMIGLAPLIWSPMSGYYGRKPIYIASLPIFVAASIGTARATSVTGLIIGRIFQAIGSSSVLSVGAGTIGDIYRPTERAKSMSNFYQGIVLGPALAPILAGVFQQYTPQKWRSMQYCLAGLGALAVVLVICFLPETTHGETPHARIKRETGARFVWYWFNPLKAVLLLRWPNIVLISINSAAAMLTTYAILVPLGTIFKTRYNIQNAALLGCLYLAPGIGNIIGTRIAGKMADHTVKKYIVKRGYRRAEDRLRAAVIGSAIVVPVSLIGAGWLVQTGAGGVAAPLVFYCMNGIGLMLVLGPSNVYLVDASQTRSAECIAINNFIRYVAGAGASAAALPCVNALGAGWTNVIGAGFSMIGLACILTTLRYGSNWREAANKRYGVTYKEADEMKKEDVEAAAAVIRAEQEKDERDSEESPDGMAPLQSIKSRHPEVRDVLRRTHSVTEGHH